MTEYRPIRAVGTLSYAETRRHLRDNEPKLPPVIVTCYQCGFSVLAKAGIYLEPRDDGRLLKHKHQPGTLHWDFHGEEGENRDMAMKDIHARRVKLRKLARDRGESVVG